MPRWRAWAASGTCCARGRTSGITRYTYCVGIAAAIQQELLVFHVGEPFRVEGHADEMEVGVETVNLDGVLNVVLGRPVAIVSGIVAGRGSDSTNCVGNPWQRIAAQNIFRGVASGAQILLLFLLCKQHALAGRNAALTRAHIKLSHHAHLQVLGRSNVAVPEVCASIRGQVVIREAGADVDRHRRIGHTVIERRGVGITVEVNRVLLEQIGAPDMPTLLRVRKYSSSSSIAISGAGILPFITPTSMSWRVSTCPSILGRAAAVAVLRCVHISQPRGRDADPEKRSCSGSRS